MNFIDLYYYQYVWFMVVLQVFMVERKKKDDNKNKIDTGNQWNFSINRKKSLR